jgi:hypothetical protein
MRLFVLVALAITAFVATVTVHTTGANAVVYCKTAGVPKGCVVRPVAGAVVVAPAAPVVVAPVAHPPVVYCKTLGVPKGCVMRR